MSPVVPCRQSIGSKWQVSEMSFHVRFTFKTSLWPSPSRDVRREMGRAARNGLPPNSDIDMSWIYEKQPLASTFISTTFFPFLFDIARDVE